MHRNLYAQETDIADIDNLYQVLSSKNDNYGQGYFEIAQNLATMDTSMAMAVLDQLEQRFPSSNGYFKTRFSVLKGNVTYWFYRSTSPTLARFLCQTALNEAYEVNDLYLIAFTSGECGRMLSKTQEIELMTTYLLQAQELSEDLPSKPHKQYRILIPLGEVLFHCGEHEKSILYTRKAIESLISSGFVVDTIQTRLYNTIAQNFEKLGLLDSAMLYYKTSLQLANETNMPVWQGLNRGFMGEILFKQKKYGLAKPLLEFDYTINKDAEPAHAAKSLQWLARIDVINGQTDSALHKATESFTLLRKLKSNIYLQQGLYGEMIYYTLADVHRAIGNIDSSYHYFNLYSSLHDSLNRVVTLSSIKTSQIRIDNERNIRAIQLLQKEKKTEELKRNFLVVAIILSAAIVFLYLKRLRLKQLHKDEMATQIQKAAEAEIKSAREQMRLFTENIISQTDLIEKLQSELQHKELDINQQRIIEEITHQTILTEQEWSNFKNLFEKIHPGFFRNVKVKAPDITVAEQRMAALIRLGLTARQMASMLGISVDSVHKSKQRLRQRLHVSAEANLEKSVAEI